mmetsp:Transcript_30284/g.51601  ORF Transcript_30284/g.51601 Transcript_30284/m.51601 type:complete len:311 (+) Transcript_30284:85-1017(+)
MFWCGCLRKWGTMMAATKARKHHLPTEAIGNRIILTVRIAATIIIIEKVVRSWKYGPPPTRKWPTRYGRRQWPSTASRRRSSISSRSITISKTKTKPMITMIAKHGRATTSPRITIRNTACLPIGKPSTIPHRGITTTITGRRGRSPGIDRWEIILPPLRTKSMTTTTTSRRRRWLLPTPRRPVRLGPATRMDPTWTMNTPNNRRAPNPQHPLTTPSTIPRPQMILKLTSQMIPTTMAKKKTTHPRDTRATPSSTTLERARARKRARPTSSTIRAAPAAASPRSRGGTSRRRTRRWARATTRTRVRRRRI